MKHYLQRIVMPALLTAAFLVVTFNGWLAFHSVRSLTNSEAAVAHTLEVINQVELIMSSAKDAETGNRGFLLTGEDAYLEPYHQARAVLPAELDRFVFLTADSSTQQARIVEMRAVIEQRLNLLQQGIDLRRAGAGTAQDRADTVRALVLTGTGKLEMDHLRRLADDAETEEHRLLANRTDEAAAAARRARITLAFATGLDMLLLLILGRYLARERGMRLTAEVTAQRLAESRIVIEAKAEEVRALNATLEERVIQRTAELETINRELEAFSYSVSHDLRAPLRTIDGFSLALEEDYAGAVDDVGRDYIQRVRSGVQRMGQLIDALLQLSRITRADLNREEIDLSAMAESIAANLKQENPGRSITFTIEPGLHANADPRLLQVALENLFNNAVKFSSKMPESLIHFGWDPAHLAWFVRDNGAGFDMAYAQKLFNAFNRLHGDKDFKGSGIGLATVARVIRRHHGRIWASSELFHGAVFWFTLG